MGRDNDGEFSKKWHEILNKASFDLMLLIIQHSDNERAKARSELVVLEREMSAKLTPNELKEMKDNCAALLSSYEKQLTEVKIYKFRRDTLDYKYDRVYNWRSGHNPRHQQQGQRRGDFSASSGLSTDESGNEGPLVTTQRRGRRFLEPAAATGRYQTRSRNDLPGGGADDTAGRSNTTRGPMRYRT